MPGGGRGGRFNPKKPELSNIRFKATLDYLKDGSIPDHIEPKKRGNFRKQMKLFKIGENGELRRSKTDARVLKVSFTECPYRERIFAIERRVRSNF